MSTSKHARSARRYANGFTIIEVMVALAVGALVVLVARAGFAEMSDSARYAIRGQRELDLEMNSWRALETLLTGAFVESSPSGEFHGTGDELDFGAWVADTLGLFGRRRVRIHLVDRHVQIDGLAGRALDLFSGSDSLRWDYLLSYGASENWAREWVSQGAIPAAVRLRVYRGGGADTLLVPLGERG